LDVISEARSKGVSQERLCSVVGLSSRRVQRWRKALGKRGTLEDRQSGPDLAPHRLLVEEKESFLSFACLEANQDASARVVAYRAQDQNVVALSASSAYRTLGSEGLMSQRGSARRPGRSNAKPEREDLTGPNQRWCWDITYLRTLVKHQFLFLYVMLDEWSRKVVAWLLAEMESFELGKVLTDRALTSEKLLTSGAKLPVILNDRGASMKAKAFRQFLQDLGVAQLFSRPRTPDDNPFVEAFFRTAKYHPQFPDRFEDLAKAQRYFKTFFPWYNQVHLHSGIGFVPPALKHAGLADRILRVRRERLVEARSRRLEVNRRASYSVKGVPSTAERL
jgi:transposase InsO family protein